MTAYYNEIDAYAAQWLRNLIAAGHIASGDVDERPIQEVKADDIRKYTQCHFFAGIGGWSYALRLAGWGDDRPVWTGSCPCQPFSVAGKAQAQKDERHLWPVWFRLIVEVSPAIVFGEQVAGAIAHGWLDDAFDDLERQGYETGAAVLPACSVGANHKRERLFFIANSSKHGFKRVQPSIKTQIQKNRTFETLDSWHGTGNPFEHWNKLLAGTGVRKMDDGVSSNLEVRPALRAYGNAIVPQVAAEFIKASEGWIEC